ncbi:acyl-CoA dehydrogenase family protein [Cryptosporangium arvum]|uniref:acyl-CoA dehydrogenase family protein n=1 Tax=Cryptosporangium arvum TaxID=80871 RepID=UPI0004BB589A|nr:acyl-CoA dehydrogenase family protein [Cryptosporangium arvum]
MECGPTEEQRALADAVDDLVARRARTTDPRAAPGTDRGRDETVWRTLGDQIGAAGPAIAEEYGGAGYFPAGTHVVLERLGEARGPVGRERAPAVDPAPRLDPRSTRDREVPG